MFRQHRIRQAEAQMAAGTRWQDYGLIFASEIGTPMDPENFSRSFSRLCQRAGPGHWHPHELRHSGASLMLGACNHVGATLDSTVCFSGCYATLAMSLYRHLS